MQLAEAGATVGRFESQLNLKIAELRGHLQKLEEYKREIKEIDSLSKIQINANELNIAIEEGKRLLND